jgi:hypothetical protein
MRSRRTRMLQVVAGLATCSLVGLAVAMGPAGVSLAARRAQDPVAKGAPPQRVAEKALDEPVRETFEASAPRANADPFDARGVAAVAPDPEQDADNFVARTRKEAADRIVALDKEANNLRVRLARVEAASAKIKAAFGGLDNAAGPVAGVQVQAAPPADVDSLPAVRTDPANRLAPPSDPAPAPRPKSDR